MSKDIHINVKNKILIEVFGGSAQVVYALHPDRVEIQIIDHDTEQRTPYRFPVEDMMQFKNEPPGVVAVLERSKKI